MNGRPVMPISFTSHQMRCLAVDQKKCCVYVYFTFLYCVFLSSLHSHTSLFLFHFQQCSQIVVTLLCSSTINTVCFTILILMTCSCVLSRIWHLEWLFCMWWATQWNNISIFRGWPHDGPHLSPTLCWDRRQLSLVNLLYFHMHMQVVTGCWYAFFSFV